VLTGERDELMANTAAYGGLRWGELTALTTGQIDQVGRVITVDRKVVEIAGHLYVEAPKNRKMRRTIYPRVLPGAEGADERCVVRADGAGRENPAGRCCGGVFIGEVPVVVGMVPVVSVDDLGDCGAGSGFVDEVLA
jgi:hypothetical protein